MNDNGNNMENNWKELNDKVTDIEKDVKSLSLSFTEMSGQVAEIYNAFVGTKINPNGYSKMLEDHAARIKKLEDINTANRVFGTILKIAGGAGIVKAIEMISSYLK